MTMPALVPLGAHTGKPPIPLKRPVIVVGSRSNAHLHLLSSKVSKAHALIINSDGKIYIRDLASRTHVIVNKKVVREADLKAGDQIQIGSFIFRLAIPSSWVTSVREVRAKPAQLEVAGIDPVRLDERVTLIGRRPTCDISLLEDSASTAHAVIFEMGGKRFIRDLGSRTGTFINGRAVHQEQLTFGDLIKIGETEFRYSPASEVPVGPVPVDEDFDELEDLVGTAPLMEEPPEVIAKRLEQEIEDRQAGQAPEIAPRAEAPSVPAQPERPATPPPAVPAESAAPIPLEPLDLEPQAEVAPEPQSAEVAREAVDEAEVPAAEAEDEALAPLDLEAEAPAEAEAAHVEEPPVEVTPVEEAPAEEAPTEEAPAGVEGLELLPAEGELDLSQDEELEAPAEEHDPEATRALPPELQRRPKAAPTISEQVIEEAPVAPPTEPEEVEPEAVEPPIAEPPIVEPPVEAVESPPSAGDTVTLPSEAVKGIEETAPAAPTADEDDLGPIELAPEVGETPPPAEPEPPTKKRRKRKSRSKQPSAEAAAAAAAAIPADGETIEPTEPTPESAQALEQVVEPAASTEDHEALTDTGFGREVSAFVEQSPEPIFEDAAASPPTAEPPAPAEPPAEDEFAALDLDAAEVDDFAIEDASSESMGPGAIETVETVLPPAEELELDVGTDETLAQQPTVPVEPEQSPAAEAEVGEVELPPLEGAQAGQPVTTGTAVPAPEPEEDDEEAATEQSPESFAPGVNQWGFLGGTQLDLPPAAPADASKPAARPPTPPPAKGVAFGRRPLANEPAPEFDRIDENADAFTAAFTGPLPEIHEVDVFSQLGAPPEDDPLFGKAAQLGLVPPATPAQEAGQASAGAAQEQPAHVWSDDGNDLDDHLADDEAAEDHVDFAAEEAGAAEPPVAEEQAPRPPVAQPVRPPRSPVLFQSNQPPRKKKRRWFFSVPFLLVLMLLVMGGAVATVWWTVPVTGVVEGRLEFANLPDNSAQRHAFYEEQRRYLTDAESDLKERRTRALAVANLQQAHPGLDPGFLGDPTRYAMLVDSAHRLWMESNDGKLRLRLTDSLHPRDDARRMEALLMAMYQQNQRLLDHRQNAEQNVRNKQGELDQKRGHIAQLRKRLDELNTQAVPPKTPGEIQAMREQVERLEAKWRQAEAASSRLQSEIAQMRAIAARSAMDDTGADPQGAVSDEALRQMEARAEELQRHLDAQRVADDLATNNARKSLDEAIAGLEAQLEQVTKQMQDVPEMKGYVTVARLLQDTVHQITTELLHDQKQQLETISELKRKLDEQLVARQNEVWANDPELKNYTDLLEIQRRRRNAAAGSADHPAARKQLAELDAAIARTEELIAKRREVLGNDLIYAEAIEGLKDVIAQSEKRLAENEKRTEQRVAKVQQALAEAAPDLEKLPEEQKKLAAELERRIVAMQAARKSYLQTLSKSDHDNAEERRKQESELAALRAQMDRKRQELLAQQRQRLSVEEQARLLEEANRKSAELTELQTAQKAAQEAYLAASQELASWENRLQHAGQITADRIRVETELLKHERERDKLAAEVEALRAAAGAIVVPRQPTSDNVITQDVVDQRSFYALLSVGGIALLFGVLMLAAHQAHARAAEVEADELEAPLFPTNDEFPEEILPPEPGPRGGRLHEPSTA